MLAFRCNHAARAVNKAAQTLPGSYRVLRRALTRYCREQSRFCVRRRLCLVRPAVLRAWTGPAPRGQSHLHGANALSSRGRLPGDGLCPVSTRTEEARLAAGFFVSSAGRPASPPAEGGRDVGEDRLEDVGVVLDAELVRDG